jgi:hypothetical protein
MVSGDHFLLDTSKIIKAFTRMLNHIKPLSVTWETEMQQSDNSRVSKKRVERNS